MLRWCKHFECMPVAITNLDLNANVHEIVEIVEIVFERYDASAWQDVVMYGLGAT